MSKPFLQLTLKLSERNFYSHRDCAVYLVLQRYKKYFVRFEYQIIQISNWHFLTLNRR